MWQHCVHRRNDGQRNLLQETNQVIVVRRNSPVAIDEARTIPQPVETEFVFDADNFRVGKIYGLRCFAVTLGITLMNAPTDVGFIRTKGTGLFNGGHTARGTGISRANGGHQVRRKRGYAATPRHGRRDESYADTFNRNSGVEPIKRKRT
jgi:hypothetical protein